VLEEWLRDPSKATAFSLMVAAILSYHRGWIVARWNHDQTVGFYEKEQVRITTDCEKHREMNVRLLDELHKVTAIAEEAQKQNREYAEALRGQRGRPPRS
jgi:hypothetical protein